ALSRRQGLVEAARAGNRRGFAAVGYSHLRPATNKTMEESHPVVPGGTALRVSGTLCQVTNALQGLDVLCVPAQGELDLGLLQDGVNTAQPVRLSVGHRLEALERGIEMGQCHGIGPAPLRLLSSQD